MNAVQVGGVAGNLPERRGTKVDTLTGLPGRDALLGRIAALPANAACGMLCIDIDQLAALNEAMGLSAGDMLIVEVSKRIAAIAGPTDLLVRFGGDEFALLLERMETSAPLESITSAMVQSLCAPYLVAGREVFVSASIGAAYGGPLLLQHAEAALARAKQSARGSWLMYSSDMARSLGENFHLETELRMALEAGQFLVYYQPKASCRSGAVTGFEALVRWQHPTRGIVPPSEFIPTLEKTGLGQLKSLGLHLSIDDFGTGYSSLSYLKRLPIDTLKVDRSFVQDITFDPNDASITRAIISMAHSLKMTVVAEGVETDAQLSTLVAEQCETIQGYFISKPLPPDAASAFLASGWTIPAHLMGRPVKERTLLLVDDEESIVLALKRLLRREGYRILSANSGAAGLELMAKNDVDVVLSDQRMPQMTGEEFLRRAKALYPNTVRIVLSGYADMQSITSAINQGAIYKFMSKPWDEKVLKEGILEAFVRKEKTDARQRMVHDIALANDNLHKDNQSLAVLLGEQSHTAMISQVALQIAQENLNQLPVPVMGLDPTGLVVLRNEAFGRLAIPLEACMDLAERFPAPQSRAPFTLAYTDPSGICWCIVARHLINEGQHRGTVLAFISNELLHV